MAYVPGSPPQEPGPLSRFLPPLEVGTVAAWVAQNAAPGSWLLDPFGFSPRVSIEAARAGCRVLVTVNNPITRFLLELAVDPPAASEFRAALAELAASKRGDERLETHLRSLYLTRCEQCGREIQAGSYLWKKGADAPFARFYECSECGDRGQKDISSEDVERARSLAAADALHRSRALERVAARDDPERPMVQEALQHYLPRPLYFLTTIIGRLESLNLSPARLRALTASILVACDAGNTLWGLGEQRPRPKQLSTSDEFREHNLWMALEGAHSLWADSGKQVACVAWPNRLPDAAGICLYEGRLKNLADEVRKEIPIAAVIGSVPRPNQAFWTFSAIWAGWLWGRPAVEPYRVALQRRRYDSTWNATALRAAFTHLSDLLALGTPFFGLLPEAEPPFLLAALTAISAAGFDLRGLAVRTQDDPIQFLWERGERLSRQVEKPTISALSQAMQDYLARRGEPASYLQLGSAALELLVERHALPQAGQDLDTGLREARALIDTTLRQAPGFLHHSTGESIESGSWGLRQWTTPESFTDRAEIAAVNFLQKNPQCTLEELERELFRTLPGLLTPARQTILAILRSYAQEAASTWHLRQEDQASRRRDDLRVVTRMVETTGARLRYRVRQEGIWQLWEEGGQLVQAFAVLASAILAPALIANPFPASRSVLVLPGGRLGLVAYKLALRPELAARLNDYQLTRFRLWRSLAEVKILTRETFEEQLRSDPVERAPGQMMMF